MKQLNLEAALEKSTHKSSPPPAAKREKKQEVTTEKKTTKAREGKVQVAGFFPPEVGRTLRLIAVEHSTTSQALLEEALRALFKTYNKEWKE